MLQFSSGSGRSTELVAFCPRSDVTRLIIESLSREARLRVYTAWPEFEVAAVGAGCAIAVVPLLDDPEAARHIRRMRRRVPGRPLILITSKDMESGRLALDFGVEELVWLSEAKAKLPVAVRRASERSFLRVVAANAEQATHLSPAVRNAIAGACRQRVPVRSLEELAGLIGLSRTGLWRAWHRSAPMGPKPKVFLDWLLLLRGAMRKTSESSWESIAAHLEVDEDTLAHVATRLIGLHLSDVSSASIDALREGFRRSALTPLGIRAPRNESR